jgi:type IV fimbrial biogenesis protein FimT
MRYDGMRTKKRELGFTLIELMVAVAIFAIMAAIAIPGFSRWLPNYRLKSAARDVYSNMQLTKMGAVRANADWAIVFSTGSNSYRVCSDDGGDGDWTDGDETVEKTVNLTDYESGVDYGHGNATDDIPGNGAPPADDITYASDVAVFNPRGTGSGGYVYLENNKNTTTYAIGTRTTGVILLRKWNSSSVDWE